MKTIFSSLAVVICLFVLVSPAAAQLRKIPAEVTDALATRYPDAKEVEWKDKLSSFSATFTENGTHYQAFFGNKGEWQSTEQEIEQAALPPAVKDGFAKSKYADWNLSRVIKIELPDDAVQYRLEIGSGDIKKRNLYFNNEGRLVKDRLTI